jgi:hypothetical protein
MVALPPGGRGFGFFERGRHGMLGSVAELEVDIRRWRVWGCGRAGANGHAFGESLANSSEYELSF